VQPVFDAARAFFEAADPESVNAPAQAGGPWLALEARDTFEDAYQMAKAGLLQAGAGGTVDVVAVYEHLARLSDLRRAVGQGFKAVQRMAALPELSTLSHGAPTLPAAESDSGRSVESAE
jgi:phosphate:Na+ symporter